MIEDFVRAADFTDFPIIINPIYRQKDHPFNNFGELYHDKTDIYIHKDLLVVVLTAAVKVNREHDYRIQIDDSLRTVDAQRVMEKVAVANKWNDDLVSRPGNGMHPKGLAVDAELTDGNGNLVDMGSHFDEFFEFSDRYHNKSHREYVGLTPRQKANREILNDAMLFGAEKHHVDLRLLPEEWWDFRFQSDPFGIIPVTDKDLPVKMRQIAANLSLDEVPYSDKLYRDSLKYVREHVYL